MCVVALVRLFVFYRAMAVLFEPCLFPAAAAHFA